jgi:hypothetical protein
MSENITDGIHFTKADTIAIYEVHPHVPYFLPAWADHVLHTFQNWEADQPIRIVHDLSQANMNWLVGSKEFLLGRLGITPQVQADIERALEQHPRPVYCAFIMSGTLTGKVSMLLARREGHCPSIVSRSFFNRQSAETWLRAQGNPVPAVKPDDKVEG